MPKMILLSLKVFYQTKLWFKLQKKTEKLYLCDFVATSPEIREIHDEIYLLSSL